MRKILLTACLIACSLMAEAKDWTQYVNPLMGTQSSFELSTGNTYPAIARPWGMNFWTPQTGKMGDGWQYTYTANKIRGFKQTHQPSPWINDYGQFSIMPVTGKLEFDEEKRASWFSHKGEIATPSYYKVYLAEHDVVTEMTPTERAVLFRFTFPENEHSYIVVDAFDKGSYVKVIPEENKIIGYTTRNSGGVPENFKNYFVIEFDKPFTYKGTFADKKLEEGNLEQKADHTGAIIGFSTRKGEIVHARIASSFISFEQAAQNLKELGNDSFEQLAQKGNDAWNNVLGKIEVEGGNLDQYRIPEAAKALQDFVDEMSNWYVRRSRERFWAKGMEQDKINAYMTLYTALVNICKAAAPMIPFMTEDIYQNLVRSNDASAPESIHLCDFPVVNKDHIDKKLEEDMEDVLDAVVMGRACRNEAAIKNRQPISRMYIKADFTLSEFYQEIIEDELNVKEVVFTDDVRDFTSYTFKPQLRTVGPKYGKQLGGIQKHLAALDGNAAMDELNADGALKFDVDGVAVELTKDDLLIDMAQKEGYVSQEDNKMTVVLDTNLTPELVEEGFVYEIISKIQTMRKEAGFEVMDKIVVYAHGNDKIQDVMKAHEDEIKSEVLADEMVLGETDGYVKEWNINKEAVTMGVKKL